MFIKRFLLRWLGLHPYIGKKLITFSADGCMAHDWTELDRGVIIDQAIRKDFAGRSIKYFLVQRTDKTTFEAFLDRCSFGCETSANQTDNPTETLVGKILELK